MPLQNSKSAAAEPVSVPRSRSTSCLLKEGTSVAASRAVRSECASCTSATASGCGRRARGCIADTKGASPHGFKSAPPPRAVGAVFVHTPADVQTATELSTGSIVIIRMASVLSGLLLLSFAITLQARTRDGEVTDEGDCGDGSGCGNGRDEASGAARAAGGGARQPLGRELRRCRCSGSCVGIHRG